MGVDKRAIVSKEADVDSTADIGPGAVVEPGVKIGPGVVIKPYAYISSGTEIGENTVIFQGAVIGNAPQDIAYKGGKTFTKIGRNNIIRENVTIHRGTRDGSATIVGDNNYLMVQSHLGHNCIIEDDVIIANGALLAGYVSVEKGAFISGNVVFHQFCRVGRFAMIGGYTGVNKDVPPYMTVRGSSFVRGVNLVGLRRAGFDRDIIKEIREAYRIIYLSGLSLREALEDIKQRLVSEEVARLVSFIESSERGVCRARPKASTQEDTAQG